VSKLRPFVLAVYEKDQKELPEGGRNPWEAIKYHLCLGEQKAKLEASDYQSDGYPVDILQVRMSSFP
jgi:hypothetical protein